MKVSVIIPALNEADNLRDTLSSVGAGPEVIVSDGGSTDATREIAVSLGATVIRGPSGRGLQMDSGALASTGEILLFLHADTRLPGGWTEEVKKAVSEGYIAGGFSLSLDLGGSESVWMKVVERVANLRARLGLIYGDQAIFARRDCFFKAGGFNKLPLMEDVDCVKRLRKLGRVVVLKSSVTTSPRRWTKGPVRNTLRNWVTLFLYFMGVSPQTLYARYYKKIP